MTKLFSILLILLGLLSLLCACDGKNMSEEKDTLGSEGTVKEETVSEVLSEIVTETDTDNTNEVGGAIGTENDTNTQTGLETEVTTDFETTSPVIELPKVEFD